MFTMGLAFLDATWLHDVSMTGHDNGGILTTEEAAELLGRHPTSVTRMVKRGVLVPIRMLKAGYLFRIEDIEALKEG